MLRGYNRDNHLRMLGGMFNIFFVTSVQVESYITQVRHIYTQLRTYKPPWVLWGYNRDDHFGMLGSMFNTPSATNIQMKFYIIRMRRIHVQSQTNFLSDPPILGVDKTHNTQNIGPLRLQGRDYKSHLHEFDPSCHWDRSRQDLSWAKLFKPNRVIYKTT